MHFPIPKPVHGQITRVFSRSNNPESASLLAIAPEIRNQIYGYLLVEDQPIKVFVDSNDDESASKTSSFSGSPAIFQTCRQIYHEAVGVLYGHNVFQFNYKILSDKYNTVLSPVETCDQWMQDIGSCLSELRDVAINMDMPKRSTKSRRRHRDMVDNFYEFAVIEIKILPLLDVFWNGVARDLSVEFEWSGETKDSSFHDLCLDAERLTQVLSDLGKMDTLNLKRQRPLLSEVGVNADGRRGTICYRSTRSKADVYRNIRLSEETEEYELEPLPSHPNMDDLPFEVIRAIAGLAITNHEVTYNFNTGVTHGNDFGMLNLNQRLRNIVNDSFRDNSQSTIILSSKTLRSSIAMFEKLDRRIREDIGYIDIDAEPDEDDIVYHYTPITAAQRYYNAQCPAPTVVLQFQTDQPLHLAAVRIGANDLLRVTSFFPADTTIVVRVCGHEESREHTATLYEIRKYMLVLLEQMVQEHEEAQNLAIDVKLNHDCLPTRINSGPTKLCWDPNLQDYVQRSDEIDIALLHELVKARTWKPAKDMRRHLCYNREPEGWDDGTRTGLINRLEHLCS